MRHRRPLFGHDVQIVAMACSMASLSLSGPQAWMQRNRPRIKFDIAGNGAERAIHCIHARESENPERYLMAPALLARHLPPGIASVPVAAGCGRRRGSRNYWLPRVRMDPLATSSVSRAMVAWPDDANGSRIGFSEYLRSNARLIVSTFTWPMLQPGKRRSPISS